ncbi:MAG TPA: PLP-dependent aspartate aminotransferase family protein [Gemmatimonadaceae bacterium]|nr:PLP-dependent aspartate aminotransferase family protein [Gemmatimonadaceae bacterium]
MSEPTKRMPGLATRVVHAGEIPRGPQDPVVTPLVQSANYAQDFGTSELLYTRYGNTPNAEVVQRRIADLEGAEAALVLASGMGATACALLTLLRPGDHVLASGSIYGGTYRLLTEELATLGIGATLVEPFDPRIWRQAVRRETRAIFVENPVNPTCRVLDLRPIATLAHGAGIALVVDSTMASPINLRPIEHGADVVIHSATKYLNGHNDVLCGVVAGSASYVEEVRQKMMVWGQVPDPFACWLLERGLKTLFVRVQRQNASAQKVAEWCATRPEISAVHYAGLPSHPDHKVAKALLDGFGGMLAFELAGGAGAAERFLPAVRLFVHAASLGGSDSLVIEPRFSSHARMSDAERRTAGIRDGLVRISIGLEDPDDLIADLEQALAA